MLSALWGLGFVFELEAIRIRDRYQVGTEPERRNAIRSLRGLDGPVVRALLVSALEDDDSEVRLLAAGGLIERDVQAVVPVVLEWLEYTQEEPRRVALRAVAHFHVEESRARVERMLSDSDVDIRIASARALGAMGEVHVSLGALVAALDDPASSVKLAVLDALATSEDTAAAPAIARLTHDTDANVRRAALVALGRLAPDDAGASALGALDDPDADVVVAALARIAVVRDASLVTRIAPMLDDRRTDVATAAAFALARFDGPEVAATLADQLVYARVRVAASDALAVFASRGGGRDCLVAVLPHASRDATREVAVRTMRRCVEAADARGDSAWTTELGATVASLVERDAGAEAVRLLLSNPDDDATRVLTVLAVTADDATSAAALTTLGARLRRVGADGRVAEPLVLALERFDEARRVSALDALAACGAARIAPALRDRFTRASSPAERAAILRALAAFADASALPLATASSASRDPDERDAALDVLVALAPTNRSAEEVLSELASSSNGLSRSVAVEAFARSPESLATHREDVVRALDDADSRVVAAALDAILHASDGGLRALLAPRTEAPGSTAVVLREWQAIATAETPPCASTGHATRLTPSEPSPFTRYVVRLAGGNEVRVTSDARGRLPRELACAISVVPASVVAPSFRSVW